MAARTRTRNARVQADNQLRTGIQKHLATATFPTRSGPVTAAEVGDAIDGRTAAAEAVVTAATVFHAAVTADAQQAVRSAPLLDDVRQCILATFPPPEVLSDCGIAPPKPRRPLTAEELLVRAAKVRATRAARGTTSAKQKARIKGTVPATLTVQANGAGD